MPLVDTPDGHYTHAITTAHEGDGNDVVYDNWIVPGRKTPVWDKFSYEASLGASIGVPTTPPIIAQPPSSGSGRLIRITGESDGLVRPVGMSYWPNINNHAGRGELRVLVSLADSLNLFTVDKASGTVRHGGPLPLPPTTGEGCYWSLSNPDLFYMPNGNALLSYDVAGDGVRVVFTARSPITQCHSSADGRVHSFTMDGGAAVSWEGRVDTFPSADAYDECQIDKSGAWLLIKEGQARKVADNRIVHLPTRESWSISDAEGAVGHSDMGFGYMVGEDDQVNPGGVFRRWRFTLNGPVDEGPVYAWGGWTNMTRYVSHCNARPGDPNGQRLLFSDSEYGLVAVTMGEPGSRTISPSFTDLNARGGENPSNPTDHYWKKTRANLDPTGEWACWSGNDGTDRMHVFVARL